MRFLVTREFTKWFSGLATKPNFIAVVGGTSRDPEVAEIKRLSPTSIIDFYGIENPHSDSNFTYLDLNEFSQNLQKKYDLILCSQVLEHVWNLESTFESLVALISKNGFLWFNCPTSNIAHGSPAYFSAGYTAEFIAENLKIRGFTIIESHHFGSPRYYYMTHALKSWATESEHAHPITSYNFQPGTILGVAHKLLKDLPGRFISLFYKRAVSNSIETATETLVIAQFKDSLRL
jgi:hypothetical protein